MENLVKLIQKLQTLPTVGKVLSCVIVLLVTVLLLFFAGSCGITRNNLNNSDNNQININTQPQTTVSADSLTFKPKF